MMTTLDSRLLTTIVGGAWGVEPRTPYGMFGAQMSYQERAAEMSAAEQAALDAGIVVRNPAGTLVPR